MNSTSWTGHGLELPPVVPEPDDDRPGIDAPERFEEQVHALVAKQLPEVQDRRAVGPEELGEAVGIALVRQALVCVAGVGRIAPRLPDQVRERVASPLRMELVDVDPGRNLVDAVDVPDHVLQHLADVSRTDEDGSRVGERVPSPA